MSPKLKKLFSTTVLTTLVGFSAFAQGPDLPPPPPPPGLVVPIDENIVILIVAGFVFGIYAVARLKKRQLS